MTTTTEPFYTQPELQPQHRGNRSRVAVILAVLVGVLVLSLAGAGVALVQGHGRYNTLSGKYDAQTSQVKHLNGQVKDLHGQVSDLQDSVRIGRDSARAAVLMNKATGKLLDGYQADVFMQLIYIEDANRFVHQALAIAKADGFSDVDSLFRAAAAGGSGTTL